MKELKNIFPKYWKGKDWKTKQLSVVKVLTVLILTVVSIELYAFQNKGNEYLDWNSFKINNKVPLLCKKTQLVALLGKPDRIETPKEDEICASYFDTPVKYLCWGESQFETSGSMAVVSSINFESAKIKLVSNKITLDNTVTLETIKRFFPIAVKNAEVLEIDKKEKVLSVHLSTSGKESDDGWLLFFKNGKLIRLDHFIPC